jgi:hypothetical protein
MFSTIHAQMTTFAIEQAALMDRGIGGSGFLIPAGSLTVFLVGSILLTMPSTTALLPPLPAASRATHMASPHSNMSSSAYFYVTSLEF